MRLNELAVELQLLTEEGASLAPGQPMWREGGSASASSSYRDSLPTGNGAGERRCPKGTNRDPNSGKCVPREQLRQQYRGHEPVAAMHREKHLAHANAAQTARTQGDHKLADKHERLAKRHLERAKFHQGQFNALGKVLYPHKHGATNKHAGQQIQAHGTRAMEFPAVQKPMTHSSFGGQAWGGKPGTPKPQASPSTGTPGYHPFGKPPEPKPPQQAAPHSPPAVSHSAPAAPHGGQAGPAHSGAPQASAGDKPPSMLHRLGQAAVTGLGQAVTQKAQHTGGLGWSALAHALNHLTGQGQTAHAPTTATPNAAPTVVDPATHHAALQHHMSRSAHHGAQAQKAMAAGDHEAAQKHWALANQHGQEANRHHSALSARGAFAKTSPSVDAFAHTQPGTQAPAAPKKKTTTAGATRAPATRQSTGF